MKRFYVDTIAAELSSVNDGFVTAYLGVRPFAAFRDAVKRSRVTASRSTVKDWANGSLGRKVACYAFACGGLFVDTITLSKTPVWQGRHVPWKNLHPLRSIGATIFLPR